MTTEMELLSDQTPFENRQLSLGSNINLDCKILHTGTKSGVQLIQVSSDRMKVSVCPTRGMGLWDIEIDGQSFCWDSPIDGPVHPNHVNLYRPDGLGWLEGFDEGMVRCGLRNVGPMQFGDDGRLTDPIHGTIANLPAKKVFVEYDSNQESNEISNIKVVGIVDDVLFHFHKLHLTVSIEIDFQNLSVSIADSIQNCGNRPADICLMHHWNFGTPIFGEGSSISGRHSSIQARDDVAEKTIGYWDSIQAPGSADSESVFFFESDSSFENGEIVLSDSDKKNAVRMTYPLDSFPFWTLWKNPVSTKDGFAIGIEPGTCFPTGKKEIDQSGHLFVLDPGTTFDSYSTVEFAAGDPKRVSDWLGASH